MSSNNLGSIKYINESELLKVAKKLFNHGIFNDISQGKIPSKVIKRGIIMDKNSTNWLETEVFFDNDDNLNKIVLFGQSKFKIDEKEVANNLGYIGAVSEILDEVIKRLTRTQ